MPGFNRRERFERDTMMDKHGNDMKEILTKSFWRDVKKTFQDALEGPPVDNRTARPPEGDPKIPSASETPSSAAAANEQP